MWARIEDNLPEHRKVFAAASEIRQFGYARALSMILQAICYANRSQSDGSLPKLIVDSFHDPNPRAVARALVKAGLWEVSSVGLDGGYKIHDYHDYQLSREELLQKQEVARIQRRQAGLASGRARQRRANEPVEREANGSVEHPLNENPTTSPPIPSQEREKEQSRVLPSIPKNGNGHHADDVVTEKIGEFSEKYPVIYAKVRAGAHYRANPVRDYPYFRELVTGWPLSRLELMLEVFLHMPKKDANNVPGTPGQFLNMAPECDKRLRENGR